MRNVRWQWADIVPDYQMGAACALFLSLRCAPMCCVHAEMRLALPHALCLVCNLNSARRSLLMPCTRLLVMAGQSRACLHHGLICTAVIILTVLQAIAYEGWGLYGRDLLV